MYKIWETKAGRLLIAWFAMLLLVNNVIVFVGMVEAYPVSYYIINMVMAFAALCVTYAEGYEQDRGFYMRIRLTAYAALAVLLVISILRGAWVGIVHFD